MKYVAAFLQTNVLMFLNLDKPFDPLLGETFQAELNGCKVYCEQLSYEPPVTAFQIYGNNFRIYGTQESTASINMNSVDAVAIGIINIKFENTGEIFSTQYSQIYLEGTTFGERTFNKKGKQIIWNHNNSLFTEIQYNPDRKHNKLRRKDFYYGAIYKMRPKFFEEFRKIEKRLFDKGKF